MTPVFSSHHPDQSAGINIKLLASMRQGFHRRTCSRNSDCHSYRLSSLEGVAGTGKRDLQRRHDFQKRECEEYKQSAKNKPVGCA
ncbi:peroxisome biogenesis factor 2 isoform X3 [Callithrix jacchus]